MVQRIGSYAEELNVYEHLYTRWLEKVAYVGSMQVNDIELGYVLLLHICPCSYHIIGSSSETISYSLLQALTFLGLGLGGAIDRYGIYGAFLDGLNRGFIH